MSKRILLVMPVPFRIQEGVLGFDEQTCRGLQRWAEQFDQVTIACPVLPETESLDGSSATWQPLSQIPYRDRIRPIALPWAYRLPDFLRHYRATRQLLRQQINQADYLCFSPGSMVGDWAAQAALLAQAKGRDYAVWIDRVEYDIDRRTCHRQPLLRRLKLRLFTIPLTRRYNHALVRRARLGLFQGQETHGIYQPISANAHCVYDVHTSRADQITDQQLQQKLDEIVTGEPLRLCYMGRAAEMKGPLDWVRSLHRIHQAGVALEATWLGDGPLLGEMRALAQRLGIDSLLHLPGFVGDHQAVLSQMRQHHLLMFCHKTPESPRCLVESLVSGTPIVGYGSAYPKGIVAQSGGGEFVPLDQWQALGDRVIALAQDRDRLARLVRAAAQSGQAFSEEEVFAHRASLLRQHLPSSPRTDARRLRLNLGRHTGS